MDSKTLANALNKLNYVCNHKYTVGVYAADRLPSRYSKPAAFIVHTENATKEIGHWVGIFVPENGRTLFFDSYGMAPYVKNHIAFLNRLQNGISSNKKCYQAPDSTVCGGYCLIFLAQKMGAIKSPLQLRENDVLRNDRKVAEATRQLLELLEAY
jgi:hypothetical protein